jgi:hypothetical protein
MRTDLWPDVRANGTDASVESNIKQAWSMRRRSHRVSAAQLPADLRWAATQLDRDGPDRTPLPLQIRDQDTLVFDKYLDEISCFRELITGG